MPMRSEWKLAREGFTLDTFGALLRSTAFNPLLTIPLYVLARYTQKGISLSSAHNTVFRYLKTFLYLSVASRVSEFLDNAVINNWTNDKYDWSKEVVVVTGGSDGIGAIVVKLLAERGIRVAVMDVQPLQYDAPPSVRYFHTDVASTQSITSSASAIRSAFGNPTILINNAGFARGKTILDTTETDLRLTFSINTISHYFLVQQFLPSMIERNHGMIVTVASAAGYAVAPQMVDYCATKAAALTFHEGLTAELLTRYKAPKVRTVIMCQNYTRTKLFEGFDEKGLYPETVAEEIVKAVLKGKSKHILLPQTGWFILAKLRGWPLWMQYGIRKRLDHLMRGYKGRQVSQPSADGKEKLAESAVLVEGGGTAMVQEKIDAA